MSEISEERLAEMSRLCEGVCADMKGTPQNCMRDLIAEILRLRAENAELRKKVDRERSSKDLAHRKLQAKKLENRDLRRRITNAEETTESIRLAAVTGVFE